MRKIAQRGFVLAVLVSTLIAAGGASAVPITFQVRQNGMEPLGQRQIHLQSIGLAGLAGIVVVFRIQVDQVLFNWFEIEYWKNLEAVNDFIELSQTNSRNKKTDVFF